MALVAGAMTTLSGTACAQPGLDTPAGAPGATVETPTAGNLTETPQAPGTTQFDGQNGQTPDTLALNVTGPDGQAPFATGATGLSQVPEDYKGVKISESSTTLSGKPATEIPPQQPLSVNQQPAAGPLEVETWTVTDDGGNALGSLPQNSPVAKPEFTEPKIYEIHNGGRRPVGQGGGDPKNSTGEVGKEIDVAGGAGSGGTEAPKGPEYVPTSGWTKIEVLDMTPPNQVIKLTPQKTSAPNVAKFLEPGADETSPDPADKARQDLHPGEKVFDLVRLGPNFGDLGLALSAGQMADPSTVTALVNEIDVPLEGYPPRTPMGMDLARQRPLPASVAIAQTEPFYVPINTRIEIDWTVWDFGDLDEGRLEIRLESSDATAVEWTADPDGLGGSLLIRADNIDNPANPRITLSFIAYDTRGNSSQVSVPFTSYKEKVIVTQVSGK